MGTSDIVLHSSINSDPNHSRDINPNFLKCGTDGTLFYYSVGIDQVEEPNWLSIRAAVVFYTISAQAAGSGHARRPSNII